MTASSLLSSLSFLIAEVGSSAPVSATLSSLNSMFEAGQINKDTLVYQPELTGKAWTPIQHLQQLADALGIQYQEMQWFYLDAQQIKHGPFNKQRLLSLRNTQQIDSSTQVWHQGLDTWMKLSEAKDLFVSDTAPTSAAAPPPPRAPSSSSSKRVRASNSTKNSSIYVTGLPSDLTIDEAHTFFCRAGVISQDVMTGEKRIRIYTEESTGKGKGDATITYLRPESIELAITLLDGVEIRRNYPAHISAATFNNNPTTDGEGETEEQRGRERKKQKQVKAKKKKKSAVEVALAKCLVDSALSWREDDVSSVHGSVPEVTDTDTGASGLRIVTLKHMFDPAEAAAAAAESSSTTATTTNTDDNEDDFFVSLTSDVGEELESRCGAVDKMTVYEHHPDGVIIVKFVSSAAAERCISLMNGRWFAGRQVSVSWFNGEDYSRKESEAQEQQRLDRFGQALEKGEI